MSKEKSVQVLGKVWCARSLTSVNESLRCCFLDNKMGCKRWCSHFEACSKT